MGDNEVYGSILGNTTINADDLEALTLIHKVDQYLGIVPNDTLEDLGITEEDVTTANGYRDRLKYFYPYGVYDNFSSNDPRKTKVTTQTKILWELQYNNVKNSYTDVNILIGDDDILLPGSSFTFSYANGGWSQPTEAEMAEIDEKRIAKKQLDDIPKVAVEKNQILFTTQATKNNLKEPKLVLNLQKGNFTTSSKNGIYQYKDIKFGYGNTLEKARNAAKNTPYKNQIYSVLASDIQKNPALGIISIDLHNPGEKEYSPSLAGQYFAVAMTVVAKSEISGILETNFPKVTFADDTGFDLKLNQVYTDNVVTQVVDVVAQVAQEKADLTVVTQQTTFERAYNLGLFESLEKFYKPRVNNLVLQNYGVPKGSGSYTDRNFKDGDFTGSDLTNCVFKNCNFEGANLVNTVINNTTFNRCTFNSETIFPLGFGDFDIKPTFYTTEWSAEVEANKGKKADGSMLTWKKWEEYQHSLGTHDALSDDSNINIPSSESNLPGFKAVWGSPFIENAEYGLHFNELPGFFTQEQAFNSGTTRVTVSDTLKFLAGLQLDNTKRQNIYKYHIDHDILKQDGNYIQLNRGGITTKIIKNIIWNSKTGEKDSNFRNLTVTIEPLKSIDNLTFPSNLRWNLYFGTEYLRDLMDDQNAPLLDLGNPFLQQGREIKSAIKDFVDNYNVPYFSRGPWKGLSSGARDPFICCGQRWYTGPGQDFQGLLSAQNVNFSGAYFNGREWESDVNYLPDAVEAYSTRLYPAIFSGTKEKLLKLNGSNFSNAQLQNVIFRYCDLTDCVFDGSILHDAIFLDNVYGNTSFKNVTASALGIDATGPQKYGPTRRKKSTGVVYFVNTSEFSYKAPSGVNAGEWVIPETGGEIWLNSDGSVNTDQIKTRVLDADFTGADIRGSRFANIKFHVDCTDIKANWIEMYDVQFAPKKLQNSAFKNLYVKEDVWTAVNKAADAGLHEERSFPIGTTPSYLRREETVNDPTPFIMVKYGSKDLRNADFVNSVPSSLNLTELQEITDVNFSGAELTGVDFSGVTLTNCIFLDCSLNNAVFDHAIVQDCHFNGSDLINSSFIETSLEEKEITVLGETKLLAGATFGGCDLTGATFANFKLTGAKFRSSNVKTSDGVTELDGNTITDRRSTILSDTFIYWDNVKGKELLGYDPTEMANWEQFKIYFTNDSAIESGQNRSWPYGLQKIFIRNGFQPNYSTRKYSNPDIYYQIIEGRLNIDGITDKISADAPPGAYLSKTTTAGVNYNGIIYDPNDLEYTSEPLRLQNLQAVGTNIEGLNFNNCELLYANFNKAYSTYDANNENWTYFKNINLLVNPDEPTDEINEGSPSISFVEAKFEGAVSFADADLAYANFTKAIITHPESTFGPIKSINGNDDFLPPSNVLRFPTEAQLNDLVVIRDYRKKQLGGGVDLRFSKFEEATLNNSLVFNYAKITGMDFNNVKNISGNPDMKSMVADGSKRTLLTNVDFTGCNFEYSVLNNCDFQGSNLSNAVLEYCDVRNSSFGTEKNPCDLTEVSFTIIGDELDYLNPSLSGDELEQAKEDLLKNRKNFLSNIDIKYAILNNTNFDGYSIKDLETIDWPVGYYSRNEDGVLQGGLQLSDVKISGAHLNYEKNAYEVNGVLQKSGVKMVSGFWKLTAGVLVMPETDFTYNGSVKDMHIKKSNQHVGYKTYMNKGGKFQLDYTYVRGHWADKDGAKIHRQSNTEEIINAKNSTFYNENYDNINKSYHGLKLNSSKIFGVDFENSDFRKIKIEDCLFYQCSFKNCQFDGCHITETSFDNCNLDGATFHPITDKAYINGVAKVVKVDMIECSLVGTSFKEAEVQELNTSLCNFSSCDFTDAILDGIALCKVPKKVSWETWETLDDDVKESKEELEPSRIGEQRGLYEAAAEAIQESVYNLLNNVNQISAEDDGYPTLGSPDQDEEDSFRVIQEKLFLHKFHSDFRSAIFKNTSIKNISVDGKTSDLNGINKDKLPPGFANKLFNNITNATLDVSGNNEKWLQRNGNLEGQKSKVSFTYYDVDREEIIVNEIASVGWLANPNFVSGIDSANNDAGRVYVSDISSVDGSLTISYIKTNNHGLRIDGPTNLERLRAGVTDMQNKLFRKVNLDDTPISDLVSTQINISNSNFSEASLKNVKLRNANAESTNFSGADLTGSVLADANLRNAQFDGANLTNVDLRGADLAGANFRNTILSGIIVSGQIDTGLGSVSNDGNPTKFADYDSSLVAKFNNAIVKTTTDNSTAIRGVREKSVTNPITDADEILIGADFDGEEDDRNFTAVAHWPYGVGIEPTDHEETVAGNDGADTTTIKLAPSINNAVNALSKLRGGIPSAGGLDFSDTPARQFWEFANKSHYVNSLPDNNMKNINKNYIVTWFPAYNSNDDNNSLESWRDPLASDLFSNKSRAQWDFNGNAPNYYGFPNVKSVGVSEVAPRIEQDLAGNLRIVRSANEIYSPHYDFSVSDQDITDGKPRTNFENVDLTMTFWPGTNFKNVNFKNSTLCSVQMRNSNFEGAILDGANFGPVMDDTAARAGNARSDLTHCSFRNASCVGTIFDDSDLGYVDFSGADLSGATFFQCNLYKADFTHANLGDGIILIGSGPWTAKLTSEYKINQNKNSTKVLRVTTGDFFIPYAKGADEENGAISTTTKFSIAGSRKGSTLPIKQEVDPKVRTQFKNALPKFVPGFNLLKAMGWDRNEDGLLVNTFLYNDNGVKTNNAYKNDPVTGVCRPSNKVKDPTPGEALSASYESTFTDQYTDVKDDTITNQDMSGLVLGSSDTELNFFNTTLNNVNLNGSTLFNADFSGADLTDVNMNESKLEDASFKDIKSINNLSMHGANLKNASFEGVDLTGVEFTNLPQPGPYNEDLPEDTHFLTTDYDSNISSANDTLDKGDVSYSLDNDYSPTDGKITVLSTGKPDPSTGEYLINKDDAKSFLKTTNNSKNLSVGVDDLTTTVNGVDEKFTLSSAYNYQNDSQIVVNTKSNNNVDPVVGSYHINKDVTKSILTTSFASDLDHTTDKLTSTSDKNYTLVKSYDATNDSSISINNSGNTPINETYKLNLDKNKGVLAHGGYGKNVLSGQHLLHSTSTDLSYSVVNTYTAGTDELIVVQSKNYVANEDIALPIDGNYLIEYDPTKTILTGTFGSDIDQGTNLENSNGVRYALDVSYNANETTLTINHGGILSVGTSGTGTWKVNPQDTQRKLTLSSAHSSSLSNSSTVTKDGSGVDYSVARDANANSNELFIVKGNNTPDAGEYIVNIDRTKSLLSSNYSSSIAAGTTVNDPNGGSHVISAGGYSGAGDVKVDSALGSNAVTGSWVITPNDAVRKLNLNSNLGNNGLDVTDTLHEESTNITYPVASEELSTSSSVLVTRGNNVPSTGKYLLNYDISKTTLHLTTPHTSDIHCNVKLVDASGNNWRLKEDYASGDNKLNVEGQHVGGLNKTWKINPRGSGVSKLGLSSTHPISLNTTSTVTKLGDSNDMHLSENADATANSLYVFNNGNNNISNGDYVVNIDRSKSLLTTTHNAGISAGVSIGAPNKTIYTVHGDYVAPTGGNSANVIVAHGSNPAIDTSGPGTWQINPTYDQTKLSLAATHGSALNKNVTKITNDASGVDYTLAEDATNTATDLFVSNNGDTLVNGTYAVNIDRSKSLLTTGHGSDIENGIVVVDPSGSEYTLSQKYEHATHTDVKIGHANNSVMKTGTWVINPNHAQSKLTLQAGHGTALTKNVTKVTNDASGVDYILAEHATNTATDLFVINNGDTLVNGTYAVNIDRSKSLLTTGHGSDIENGTQVVDPSGVIYTLSQKYEHASHTDVKIGHANNAVMKTGTWIINPNNAHSKLTLQSAHGSALTKNVTKITNDASGVDYYIAADALANATSIEVDNDGDALVTGNYAINIDRSKSLLTTDHGSDISASAYIKDPSGANYNLGQDFTHANQNDILVVHGNNAAVSSDNDNKQWEIFNPYQTKLVLAAGHNASLTKNVTVFTNDANGSDYNVAINADANATDVVVSNNGDTLTTGTYAININRSKSLLTTNLNSDLSNGTQIFDPSGVPFQLSQAFDNANQNDILISHPANVSMKTGTWNYQVQNTAQTKLTLNAALTNENTIASGDTVTLDGSGVNYPLAVAGEAGDTELFVTHGNNAPTPGNYKINLHHHDYVVNAIPGAGAASTTKSYVLKLAAGNNFNGTGSGNPQILKRGSKFSQTIGGTTTDFYVAKDYGSLANVTSIVLNAAHNTELFPANNIDVPNATPAVQFVPNQIESVTQVATEKIEYNITLMADASIAMNVGDIVHVGANRYRLEQATQTTSTSVVVSAIGSEDQLKSEAPHDGQSLTNADSNALGTVNNNGVVEISNGFDLTLAQNDSLSQDDVLTINTNTYIVRADLVNGKNLSVDASNNAPAPGTGTYAGAEEHDGIIVVTNVGQVFTTTPITVSAAKFNADARVTVNSAAHNSLGKLTVSASKFNADGRVTVTDVGAVNDGTMTVSTAKFNADGRVTVTGVGAVNDGTMTVSAAKFNADGRVTVNNVSEVNDGTFTVSASKLNEDGRITVNSVVNDPNDGTFSVNSSESYREGEITVSSVVEHGVGNLTVTGSKHAEDGRITVSNVGEAIDGTITVTNSRLYDEGTINVTGSINGIPTGHYYEGNVSVSNVVPYNEGTVVVDSIEVYNEGKVNVTSTQALRDNLGEHKDAKFENTNFSGATNANLAKWPVGVDYSVIENGDGIINTPSLKVQLDAGRENFKGVTFDNEDLTDSSFGGHLELNGVNYTKPTLENAVFKPNVVLQNVDFSNADLSGVNFSGVDVTGANFSNSDISNVLFTGMKNADKAKWPLGFDYDSATNSPNKVDMPTFLEKVRGYPTSDKVNGQKGIVDIVGRSEYDSDVVFTGHAFVDVSKAFVDENLRRINLMGQDITDMDVTGTNLRDVNLSYSNCTNVKFTNTKDQVQGDMDGIKGANFVNADLTNADFSGCDVGGCDFRFSKIQNTNFAFIKNWNSALWPAGINVDTGGQATTTWDYNSQANLIKLVKGNGETRWLDSTGNFTQYGFNGGYWAYNSLAKREKRDKNIAGLNDPKYGVSGDFDKQTAQMNRFYTTTGYNFTAIVAETHFTIIGAGQSEFSTSNQGVDLSGALMTNANFNKIDLRGVNFTSANVSGLTLSGAKIHGFNPVNGQTTTKFNKASFGSSANNGDMFQNIFESELPGVGELRVEYVDPVLGSGSKQFDIKNMSHMEFNDTNLAGFNLSNLGLHKCEFKNTDLTGTDFKGSVLVDVDFTGSNLSNTDFSGCIMHNVNLNNCNLNATIFEGVKNIAGDVVVEVAGKSITGLVMPKGLNYLFDGSYMDQSNPVSTDFITNVTTFDYSIENNVKRAAAGQVYSELKSYNGNNELYNFQGANLNVGTTDQVDPKRWMNTDFSGVDMSGADLTNSVIVSDMTNVNLTNATIVDSRFVYQENGTWINADMSNVDMTNVDASGLEIIVKDGNTFNAISDTLDYAKFNNADFSGVIFQHGTNVSHADFTDATFTRANLEKSNVEHGKFIRTNLEEVNLMQSSLNHSVFEGTGNQDTMLSGVRFAEASLTGVEFKNLKLSSIFASNLGNPDMSGGRFENVDFTPGVCVAGNLTNVVFKDTSLEGADFNVMDDSQETVLDGSVFENVTFAKTDLHNLSMVEAQLQGAVLNSTVDVSLNGTDLSGANLVGADLTGTNLAGCNLFHTDLTNATLVNVNLLKVDEPYHTAADGLKHNEDAKNLKNLKASGSTISGVDLAGLSLEGANLSNASLIDISFNGAVEPVTGDITATDLSGANLSMDTEAKKLSLNHSLNNSIGLVLDHVNFGSEANLSNLDLSGVSLMHASLIKANLESTHLTGVAMHNIDLREADMSGVDMSGVKLYNAKLNSANLNNVVLANSELQHANFNLASNLANNVDIFENCDLSSAHLTNVNLTGVDFTTVTNLKGVDFENATLVDAVFDPSADFSHVNLKSANLTNVDLSGIKLEGVSLHSAVLTATDLSGSDLSGIDMQNSVDTQSALSGKVFKKFSHINLSGLNLTGVDLTKVESGELTSVHLVGAHLNNSHLDGLSLVNVDLTNAHLVGADLSGVTLDVSCNLTNADLSGVKLDGANVNGVDFSQANNLSNVNFHVLKDKSLTSTNFSNVTLSSGKDMSGLVLEEANLSGAVLSGVNLSGANLRGVNLLYATLVGANLSNADLTGANLEGVDLSGANLEGADLTNVVMKDANVHSTKFVNVTFSNTNMYQVENSQHAVVTGNDLRHEEYANADGSFSGYRSINNSLTDANGNVVSLVQHAAQFDLGLNSRGLEGNEPQNLQK